MSEAGGTPSAAAERKAASRHARWAWEHRLPVWQQRINRFCENWIFAFIVAMAIRHFALEAYRIPTASMEPVLYGDESIASADHVVVDKFLFRFTGPERWGVTVFQFPWPEIDPNTRAWTSDGDRLDHFPFKPLLNRNFVKRCVVKPGDVFYFSGGDLYLQQEDGSWQVPRKPDGVQEALWLPIYRAGADPDWDAHVWQTTGSGSARLADGALEIAPAGGRIVFRQPFINLYVKPGVVGVRPESANVAWQAVSVSLIEPTFEHPRATSARFPSIWNLDDWDVARVSAAEIDNIAVHGRDLDDKMNEPIGDVRIAFTPRELTGEVLLRLREQDVSSTAEPAVEVELMLGESGWAFRVDGEELATGSGSLASWTVVNCDNRVWLERAGEVVVEPVAVAATDPVLRNERTQLTWEGSGRIVLADLAIDRDVHYSARGFLSDERKLQNLMPVDEALFEMRQGRGPMIEALVDDQLRERLLASMAQSRPGNIDGAWLEPIGTSPERALRAPENGYLLLGDNSPFSWDSRNWGWVPSTNLRGEVLAVVFPFGRAKFVE